jgi:hypothetical protein
VIYPLKILSVQYIIVDCRYKYVQQVPRTYSSCLTETLCPVISNPWKSPFCTLVLWIWLFLDAAYKWDHTVSVYLWPIYFTWHNDIPSILLHIAKFPFSFFWNLFFALLGFELRTSCLLVRCSTSWATPLALISFYFFFFFFFL